MDPSTEAWQLANGYFTRLQSALNDGRSSFFLEKRDGRKIDSSFDSSASLSLWIRSGEDMKWLWKMIFPARRVLGEVASRINFRQSGLLKLRSDVRDCEYEDVRVMWEMLKRNETELVRSDGSRKRQIWSFLKWATSAPCLGRRF